MKLPESILTNNPKEAISFCIAYGIEEGILPKDFNLSSDGYDILQSAVNALLGKRDDEIINEIMFAFITGFATGSGQVEYKS